MKKYCLIYNGEILRIGELPKDWNNVSNFNLINDSHELKEHGWYPIEVISDNKEIIESIEYIIGDYSVKEIIHTRDKTDDEKKKEIEEEIKEKWDQIRNKRNNLLSESDIYVVSDRWDKMDSNSKINISNYRQLLREIPQSYLKPSDVIWPIKP